MNVTTVRSAAQPKAQAAPRQITAPARPAIAQDVVKLGAPATVFDLPGLKAGQTLKIANGSNYKGHGFGGKATVNAYDGQHLDLLVNAKVFLFFSVNIHLHFERQADGTVRFLGERAQGGDPSKLPANTPSQLGAALTFVSQQGGKSVFKAPDGGLVTVEGDGKGGVAIAYGPAQIVLQP